MRRRIGFILALAAVLVFVGCGDGTPTGLRPIAVVSGNGPLAISVSGGVTPTISWAGGRALRLSVVQADGGGVMWDLEALDPDIGFDAPVTHGLVPNTARERSDEVILEAGTDYRVTVTRLDGSQDTRTFRVSAPGGSDGGGGTTF